ncbi:MAG: Sensor phosphatase [Frankiales bacterium]|nr:Sensor phosphatase [Frankiales bacterium]
MDYAALFAALPTPYLVMTPDLVICGANDAYLASVGRTREELLGQPVFEAFPPTPDAMDPSGVSRIQLSFERARDTGKPDTMPVQKYDIPDPATGGLIERYWSLISVPVLDEQGRTTLILQRAEDITEYVKERERGDDARRSGEQWQRKVQEVEADLFARGQELQEAEQARVRADRRLGSLAEVALQLTSAQTVEQLTDVIFERGLVALGADGGAVAVREGPVLQLAITDSLGEQAHRQFAELPLDGPLPASVVAATGERYLTGDLEPASATPEMLEVYEVTGCRAWASLPLRTDAGVLGSLSVGWVEKRTFSPEELEVLDALAAQCAQGLERIQVRQAERRAAAAAQRMSETLQRSLLTDPPQPEGLAIAVRYRPAAQEAQVGGDWYDAFFTSDGVPAVAIGDVAGHDRDAAAVMGQVRNLLRGIAYTLGEPPAKVLSALDRALRDLAVASLATAVFARLLPCADGTRLLRWSNAGHPPPLVLEPDGTVHVLRTEADLLLGLDAGTARVDHDHVLAAGATLLLYTDGLVERREASIDEGVDRLAEVVAELSGAGLDELCDLLLDRLGEQGDDDIALLAVRVL